MALLFFFMRKNSISYNDKKTLINKRRFNMFSKKMNALFGVVYTAVVVGTCIVCKSQYDANKSIKRVNDLKLKQMETDK